MSHALHKAKVRDALPPRREPYWGAPLAPGRFVGYRRIDAQRGSWIARARDPETGKQLYHALGEFSATFDFNAASKGAHDWFAQLDEGVVTKSRFTVEDACGEYVEELERAKREKAAADAEWRFERAVDGTDFGRVEVIKLRAPTLKRWRDALLAEDEDGRQMTKAGANRMMTALRAALNLAVTNNRVPSSAAQAWRAVKAFPKADGRREIYLDIAQRRALLETAKSGLRDLIEAALLTGARPGELVGATRAAFDGRTKTLTLSGKTGTRTVPLVGAALALFERLAKSKLPAALLLMREDGKPWTKIEVSRQVRAAAAAAVVKDAAGKEHKLPPGVVLYTMRHSAITQMLLDGMTTLDVARLTGTSLQMIQAHYGQFAETAVRERLEKVHML